MLKPGMTISHRYDIVDKVGSGGMADVYKAKDKKLNRFVAIKVLKREYSTDKNFVNKFRGEAQSAAGLSHPNIVNVYDVGDEDGLHYIVMELVEGITLKRFIERKGKIEVKEAVGIAIQIAQGMEAAHDNNIIHRDIKPQNIIISREGKVKVTDFGIAKATNSNTITSNAMGSVHYLSPEQARGGYSDEKSDIYSLGVTLYEMLSGKVPFAGDNTVSVALLHIQGEAMPLKELDPSIPYSVDKIVQKCMQKRPERRYHSASELIIDLKRAIANPNGDFVQIPAFVASDSPTINISDDLGRIKKGSYPDEDIRDNGNQPTDKIEEEEEDLDTVDTKVEKFLIAGSIVTILILAAAIMFIVVKFVFPNFNKDKDNNPLPTPTDIITEAPSPTETVVPTSPVVTENVSYEPPNVIGMIVEDAKAAFLARDPDAEFMVYEEYSDEQEEGKIFAQYPQPTNDPAKGSMVMLYISLGSEPFEITNVYNYTEEVALEKLKNDLGLDVTVQYMPSDEVEKGRVISTDPPRHTQVIKGDKVTMYVSTGPEDKRVVVPDLLGFTEMDASKQLKDLGLSLGEVNLQPSETYAAGLITYQSTTAGEKVDPGTKIDVIVSTGPENIETGGDVTPDPDPEGEPDPEPTVVTRYIGTVTIHISPFDYIEDESAEIILEMVQDGYKTSLIPEEESILTDADFPLTVEDIDGESLNPGIVTMYVNGEPFMLPGETEPTTFEAVFVAEEE
ncbi:MAG TPA: Stk1 family PASTA domain-containing Ser/Thr kinase [Clostridiales bacterium]|nr:Stk1 family PASTA domain-containing Ser/Thr kinase [Clostridiales bacterium]